MTHNKLRLLVIPSWYPPRGGDFFADHSLALARSGINTGILAIHNTSMGRHGLKRWIRLPQSGFRANGPCMEYHRYTRIIPGMDKANTRRWIKQGLNAYEIWAKEQGIPDIILAHSSVWGGALASIIKKRYGIPYIITEHRGRFSGSNPHTEQWFRPWHFPIISEALNNANRIVLVSHSLSESIIRLCPECHLKVSVIPNMTNTHLFKPETGNTAGHPPRPFAFFCLADLEPVKAIDVLLKAAADLKERHGRNFQLAIGGDGSQKQHLIQLSNRLGLADMVLFPGRLSREQAASGMKSCDAFVLASHFEAFGIVYIEAMACGKPVIATNSGGPPDFVTPNSGLLVQPGNVQELSDAMAQMMDNHHHYDSQAISSQTRNAFSEELIASKYIELFSSIKNPQKP